MGYEFECKKVIEGCEGKVSAESEEETLEAAGEHAKSVHGIEELDEATTEAVKAAIVPA